MSANCKGHQETIMKKICYSNSVFFELFQNGNVSSGEESVMNGVNTDNDETSKDSEGKVMLCFWIILSKFYYR